jgi:hypothetical protein
MRKFLAFLLAVAAIAAIAAAETHVPAGPVSGVWNAFNSPYLIEGNINIPAEDSLTMMPGTVVIFQNVYTFDVYGTLNVNGQAGGLAESVQINCLSAISGAQFNFHSATTQSHLLYSILEKISLYLGPAPTYINYCKLQGGGKIIATGSSGNILTNSELFGELIGGSNWLVQNNSIQVSHFGANLFIESNCIANAGGQFIGNYVHAQAQNTWEEMGGAAARGFYGCYGTFEYNTILAHASAYFYSPYSRGLDECSGICRYNCFHVVLTGSTGINHFNGIIQNCTISNSWTGIADVTPGPVMNCIVTEGYIGFSGSFEVLYCDVFDCQTPYAGVIVGPGNIQSDPLLVDDWFLSPGSPCIDTGDPISPLDPDCTRADMGAHYYDQSGENIDVTLTPLNPPIVIPAQGGNFNFNASVVNNGPAPVPFSVWAGVRFPDSSWQTTLGPVNNLNPPVGVTITRLRIQNVPGSWSAGQYTYVGYCALTYPGTVIDSSFFTFSKSTAGDGGATVWEASCAGEPFPNEVGGTRFVTSDGPERDMTKHVPPRISPNPFNATTVASFELPVASYVQLTVYDTAGRLVTTLVDGYSGAGGHDVTFDGSRLVSGIYLVRLEAGSEVQVVKIILLK